jgi:hypothetical protein
MATSSGQVNKAPYEEKTYYFLKPIYLYLKADYAFCTDQRYKTGTTMIQLNMKLHVRYITSSLKPLNSLIWTVHEYSLNSPFTDQHKIFYKFVKCHQMISHAQFVVNISTGWENNLCFSHILICFNKRRRTVYIVLLHYIPKLHTFSYKQHYIHENAKCPENKYIIRTYVISTYIHSILQNLYQQMTFLAVGLIIKYSLFVK